MNDQLEARMACVPLGPWIDLCRRAGVPHVPAEFSQPFPAGSPGMVLSGMETPEFDRASQWAGERVTAIEEQHQKAIIRWECCSPSGVKHMMATGQGYNRQEATGLQLDDERIETPPFGCTIPDKDGNTRLVVRPWVNAVMIDRYPLELRVFYGPDGFQGVSSYYPQRPLPDYAIIDPHRIWLKVSTEGIAFLCRHLADALWDAGDFPAGFTADFIRTVGGEVLFLEGGPPHVEAEVSASPCCFPPGKVSGVALAAMPGALTGREPFDASEFLEEVSK